MARKPTGLPQFPVASVGGLRISKMACEGGWLYVNTYYQNGTATVFVPKGLILTAQPSLEDVSNDDDGIRIRRIAVEGGWLYITCYFHWSVAVSFVPV